MCVFQIELYDLPTDCFLQSKVNLSPEEFWKLFLQDKFSTLRNFSFEMISLFGGSTRMFMNPNFLL